jgi:class 3 adenylate cyclase
MDFADWLRKLELEEYEPAFRENNIDMDLLPSLTSDDLKDLGIKSVGHRRRLLDATALLRDRMSAPDGARSLSDDGSAIEASPVLEAERRQLTVMFCDLVGSTALSASLDPEDMRDVIAAYHACLVNVMSRFGGFVAQYMGDGALVYFGYPDAHENDPERAARAGLALIEAVAQLCTKAGTLRVRIGIATGLVVVGDLSGAGAAQEHGIVGDTPNLAARLQALAEPNTLIVAPTTHRSLGRLFEYEDLGAVAIKGFTQPIRTWCVLRESAVESRFEALHSKEAPLVGREEEIELLLRRWAEAKAGEGRVVLLSGEPGIGKSRITEAFQDRIPAETRVNLRYFCSPFHQDSTLRPVITQIERAAGFERDNAPEHKFDKLEALLAPTSTSSNDLILLAELLSIAPMDRYTPLRLSPQQRKERTLEALLRYFERLARLRPTLMIFEDVHWIDPTSRELLERAVDRVAFLPMLMILTFRPEFQPPWVGTPHVALYPLHRLSRREGAALVHSLVGKPLAGELVEAILARTDGVPLFIEELTKTVLEGGLVQEEPHQFVLAGPLPELAIPTTLQASLMARLDRLEGSRKLPRLEPALAENSRTSCW